MVRFAALATLAALAAALAVAGPAFAQDQSAADGEREQFSPSHLRAAQRVILLTKSDLAFDDILPKIETQTRTTFIRSNPALTREIEEATMEVALQMTERRLILSRILQEVWARRFTEEELEQMVAFFGSDVGRKFTELTPVITALSVGAARQYEEQLSAEMLNRTRAKLREEGHL